MISWIQRSFQRHFKWLFIILLGIVIVSFVFITNTSGGMGQGGDRRQPPRPFFGTDLSLAPQQRQLVEDARLSIFLRFNPAREVSDAELSQYALNRHATLALADRLGLPQPTQEQLLAHIREQRAFADPATGRFDPKRYAEFTDSIAGNPRLTEGDISRVLSADARAVAYQKLLAGPGYVLPSDVAEIIAQRDTVWTLAVASIDGSGFAPRIDTSDTAVAAWFETNARRYEIPPRVSIAALRVPSSAFADSAAPTDAELRAAYDANPARYPIADASSPTVPEQGSDAAFEAARPLVEAELRKTRAERAALQATSDLGVQLFESATQPADLPAFIATRPDTELLEIGEIGDGSVPAQLGGPGARAVLNEAKRLSAERPYSNPVAIPFGAAILVWRADVPARTPDLSEVRDRVLADYQAAEKRRLFSEAGRALQTAASAAVESGAPFETAVESAAEQAGLRASVNTPSPFSLSGNFPQDLDYAVLSNLESLAKGRVSDFLPVGENSGRLVYVIEQQIPELDPASTDYIRTRDEFAANISQANAAALLSGVVENELAKSAPVVE